jgi:hypothetical protein
MALSYGPARALAKIGGVGFVRGLTAMIATEGLFLCAVTLTSARKHCEHGVSTIDAPQKKRQKSRKNYILLISVIGNPLKVDILLSRAKCYLFSSPIFK